MANGGIARKGDRVVDGSRLADGERCSATQANGTGPQVTITCNGEGSG